MGAARALMTLCVLVMCLLSAPLAMAQAVSAPPEAALQTFWGSVEDAPAQELLGVNDEYKGRSYLAGDEWNLHLYYEHIKNLGGGYVGVGSDQGYLLMSWQRPDYAWLMDYDPLVIETHKIYRVFFAEADSPRAFLALWAGKEATGLALLDRELADDKNLKLIKQVYKDWRVRITVRHRRVIATLKEANIPSYLSDQAHYDYVRSMVAQRRARPLVANLIDVKGMRGISQAAKAMSVPVRVLYMSNAQQYWSYPQAFRDNIAALPFDERSFVLHTLSTWTSNKDYRYVLQAGLNFAAWMRAGWVTKVAVMIPRRKINGPDDIEFIHFTRDVEAATAAREKKKAKKR